MEAFSPICSEPRQAFVKNRKEYIIVMLVLAIYVGFIMKMIVIFLCFLSAINICAADLRGMDINRAIGANKRAAACYCCAGTVTCVAGCCCFWQPENPFTWQESIPSDVIFKNSFWYTGGFTCIKTAAVLCKESIKLMKADTSRAPMSQKMD